MENFSLNNKKISKIYKSKKIKIAVSILLFLTSVGILIYFCMSDNNLIKLIDILPHLNVFWLLVALFSMLLSWYFDSKVISETVSMVYFKKYSRIFFFRITMTGQYFTALTPLGIAGQPMQVVELYKSKIPKSTALIIMTRKFFIYQSSLAIYSLIISAIYLNHLMCFCPELTIFLIIGIIFQCFIVFLIIMFSINKKFVLNIFKYILLMLSKINIVKNKNQILSSTESKLDFFARSNKFINKNKKANFKLYMYTFLQITFLLLVPFFIYKSFNHEEMHVFEIMCTQSVVNTVSSFTPLPGSAGTAEKGFLVLFGSFFLSGEIAIAMLICRFITFYLSIILGMIFYKIPFKKGKRNHSPKFKF